MKVARTYDLAASDESLLLQTCLRCDYSLRGLPITHCCPECGEAFDRRWRVLNPLITRGAHHRIFLSQMVLSCSLVGVGIHQLITQSRSEFAYVWIGFGVAVAGRELWRRRSCSDPRVNLVVGPEGIFIARRGQSAGRNARFVIPWKDVSSVHSSWIYGKIVIKCGTVRHTVSWRELFEERGWSLGAWQCVKAIREYGCTYGMRLGPQVRIDDR